MKFVTSLFLLLFFVQLGTAQDVYVFTQGVNTYWNTASNWTCPSGPCPPTTIASGDTVKINGFCVLNPGLSITNNGVVQVISGSTLSMEEIGWFNNHGTLEIPDGSNANNDDGGVYRLHDGSVFNLDGSMEIFDDFGGDLRILTGSTMNIGPTGMLTYY